MECQKMETESRSSLASFSVNSSISSLTTSNYPAVGFATEGANTNGESPISEPICVTLQLGVVKEYINLDRASLEITSIKQRAQFFLEKHFPNQKTNWLDKMLLFKHNYESQNMLQLLDSVDEINNGTVLEIVLSSKNDKPDFPHNVVVHSYYSPTFCDYCGAILVGLSKQGVKCSKCVRNFHKKCAFAPHNNCANRSTRAAPMVASGSHDVVEGSNGYGLPHTFVVHSYKKPTVCKVCNNLLLGIIKQGLQCRDCKVNVHKKCCNALPLNCHSVDPMDDGKTSELESGMDTSCNVTSVCNPLTFQAQPEVDTGDLIPLGRIPGTANGPKPSRQRLNPSSMEGWMLHFTNHNTTRKRHYWRMDSKSIILFQDESLSRYYKIIHLPDILGVNKYEGPPLSPHGPPHCFEIITSTVNYYVGENLEWYSRANATTQIPRRESGLGLVSAAKWLQFVQDALMPLNVNRKNLRLTNGNSIDKADSQMMQESALEFTALYQVFKDEVLGTGQFGTVYSGVHRSDKRNVAIKEINKERAMSRKWRDALRNEVGILQNLEHPGIITLEAMFEFPERIYVIMEKMQADMLEMILSNKEGRLTERVCKFLTVQVFQALKYLHEKDIAHCDLKPENVLLSSSETDFPQAKLCDFGYARIIGENSFRKTVVGTPAYLAPEVLQKRGYNKSLDMWSAGVVIYVTLSGTFPFNEGEEIEDQIQNAAFMYPANPWQQVSTLAIEMINNLLQVHPDKRYTIEQCVQHNWLNDAALLSDLRTLESQMGMAYLSNFAV